MNEIAKQIANQVLDFLEANLGKSVLVFAALVTAWAVSISTPTNDPTASTVMITNGARTSGGTGVIHDSAPGQTTIITNSHVCGVVANGGLVIHKGSAYTVNTFKRSTQTDLCLITISANLGVNTAIANRPPREFEVAYVSGHPHLLPVVPNEGHFSGKDIIEVLTGFEPCTDEDLDGPFGLICALVGGKPILKHYQAQLVSATIMPGSSGSGVYNSEKQLTGLVFAGSGEFGYGWIIPYESLINFLRVEAPTLEAIKIGAFNPYAALPPKLPKSFEDLVIETKKICDIDATADLKNVCNAVKGYLVWTR